MTPLSADPSSTPTHIYYAILSSDNSRYNKLIPLVGTPYLTIIVSEQSRKNAITWRNEANFSNYQDAFFNHFFCLFVIL